MDTFLSHFEGKPVPLPDPDDTAESSPSPPALTLADFQSRVATWRKRAIRGATLNGQVNKLVDESTELIDASVRRVQDIRKILNEVCDLIIVGCNVADLAGESLAALLDKKMTTNEQRIWKTEGGKAQHVEGTS
jgi:NTP pyrophosphatase (non-canonical NTP hydrolase)